MKGGNGGGVAGLGKAEKGAGRVKGSGKVRALEAVVAVGPAGGGKGGAAGEAEVVEAMATEEAREAVPEKGFLPFPFTLFFHFLKFLGGLVCEESLAPEADALDSTDPLYPEDPLDQ